MKIITIVKIILEIYAMANLYIFSFLTSVETNQNGVTYVKDKMESVNTGAKMNLNLTSQLFLEISKGHKPIPKYQVCSCHLWIFLFPNSATLIQIRRPLGNKSAEKAK